MSLERVDMIGRTIKRINSPVGPSLIVFQEVLTGGGGARAVEWVVDYLNTPRTKEEIKFHDPSWTSHLSAPVNPQTNRREVYAVIYRESVMGCLLPDPNDDGYRLLTHGFSPLTSSRNNEVGYYLFYFIIYDLTGPNTLHHRRATHR